MKRNITFAKINPVALGLALIFLAALVACAGGNELPFLETFDQQGTWSSGEDAYSIGLVRDGVYDFTVLTNDTSRWAAAGKNFTDGLYEVEATPVAGPLDNGYGMLIRANPQNGDFYLFKVSGDGYVWIGHYQAGAEQATIVGDHWFESPAVRKGLNVTNKLGIRAEAGNLIFYVNDFEVGRVTDNTFTSGDIGVLVQTLGGSGVQVLFDNFSVKPLS